MTHTSERSDARLAWTRQVLDDATLTLASASADASFRSYWRTQHQGRSWIVMDSPPAQEDPVRWIEAGQAWVGESDSMVMAVLVAEYGDHHLIVRSAVVDPDWQGEGHGRALLDHAEALAREAGLAELHLTTNTLMERNISLYRHCGYRVAGQRPHPSQARHTLADMVKPV